MVEAWLVTAVIAIWIFAVVMAWSVAQARHVQLLEAAMNGASFTAKDLATAADLQLRYLSRHVEAASADPKPAPEARPKLGELIRSLAEQIQEVMERNDQLTADEDDAVKQIKELTAHLKAANKRLQERFGPLVPPEEVKKTSPPEVKPLPAAEKTT